MSTTETSEADRPSDGCPAWAAELIRKIYLLEIEAGSIKNPSTEQWSTTNQDELLRIASSLDDSMGVDLDQETTTLFERVARGLSDEDFTPEEIAGMINSRIPTGCNLKYCSSSEVLAAL